MRKIGVLLGLILLGGGAVPGQASAQDAAAPVHSEPAVRYDSSAVVARTPDPEALQVYRNDPDFAYDRDVERPLSWWGRFMAWLRDKIFGPLADLNAGRYIEWLFYVVAAIGIVFAVTRLLRMEVAGVFSPKPEHADLGFDTLEEDIRELDFDRLVEAAVAARQYRRAVRLLYLKTLKNLADRHLIDWQRDKTNHEYIDELRRPALRGALAELTTLFEYVWYGDFSIDEGTFGQVRRRFSRFSRHLREDAG